MCVSCSTSELLDLQDYPNFFFTGVASVEAVGSTFRSIYWDWIKVGGVWQRKVVGIGTRPAEGVKEDCDRWRRAVLNPLRIEEERSVSAGTH